MSDIHKSLGDGSGWINDSVIDLTINVSFYNSLAVKLPKELE